VNCTGTPTGLFFDEARQDEAKAICNGCKARTACLDKALRSEPYGVWGGTTPEERVLIRRLQNLELDEMTGADHPKCGTNAGYHRLMARRKRGETVSDCEPCRLAHNEYAYRGKKNRETQ